MRIDRMLSITVMLLNRDRISARELADKFEVSVRTIYRDIDAINLAGIPIVSYQGNNGGFSIMENFTIDRQILTLKDMSSILSALKGINTTLEDAEIDTAINKIKSLVPKDKTSELELYNEQITIDFLPWGSGNRQRDKIKIIQRSISNNRLIEFVYRNVNGERISRVVEPMTLILKGQVWYLFAYCCKRVDFRLFRVSRMSDLNPLESEFIRREKTYHEFMMPDEQKLDIVHLVLKFSPKVESRIVDFFDEDQIFLQENGEIIVNAAFPEDEWVYSFILSYGEYVEVIEPLHVKKIIQEKAKKIISIYKPDIMVSQE